MFQEQNEFKLVTDCAVGRRRVRRLQQGGGHTSLIGPRGVAIKERFVTANEPSQDNFGAILRTVQDGSIGFFFYYSEFQESDADSLAQRW